MPSKHQQFREKVIGDMERKLRMYTILKSLNDEEFRQVAMILEGSIRREVTAYVAEEKRLDAMMDE